MEWISVEDKPLFTRLNEYGDWVATEYGDDEFIAAVPYVDKLRPDETDLWWIRHCTLEDSIGLVVIAESGNEPCGWDISDVTHWMPLPKPPKKLH